MWIELKAFAVKLAKDLFTEDGNKWSLTRLTSAVCVIAPICWVTYVVHHTNSLPDLTGPTLFVGGGAVHAGLGKYSEWAQKKLGMNGNGDQK